MAEPSPLSAAATDDAHHDNNNNGPDAAAAVAAAQAAAVVAPPPSSLPPPPPPVKVRLMVSYGGRIQPRPHDNQLSYVNGDTKILSIERPLRFPDFVARLAALAGTRSEICVKYQLPGEDLDALVSVTNDEDLEHLVIEYDRLHLFRAAPGSGSGSSRGGSTPRLRVFLFPVLQPSPPPATPSPIEPKQEQQREWYLDIRSASPTPQQQQLQKQETILVHSPPHPVVHMPMPQPVMLASRKDLDLLYTLDCSSFVPPPAVKVRDPAGEPPMMRESVPVEIPPKIEDRLPNPAATDNPMLAPPISPNAFQRQIHEKLQFTDNATLQAPPAPASLAAQQPPPAPASVVVAQQPPPAPAPVVVAQQAPPAPAPVVAQQPPPAPAPAPTVAPVAPVAAALPRNGSDDSLTRTYPPAIATTTAPPEYYVPKFPEKPQVRPPSSAPPAAYLPVPPGRYASVAPGNGADSHGYYFIPGPPPHGYYASSNPAGTSYYAVAPPHNGNGNGNGTAPAPAMTNAQAYPQVAYDSNGRAVFYTGILPQQYPSAINGMSASAAILGSEPSKPVAVKPTVS